MKIKAAQIATRIFQWEFNTAQIISVYKAHKNEDCIVFPMNAISGGPLYDLIAHPTYKTALDQQLTKLSEIIDSDVVICFPQQMESGQWSLIWIDETGIHHKNFEENISLKSTNLFFLHPSKCTDFSKDFKTDWVISFQQKKFDYQQDQNFQNFINPEVTKYWMHITPYGFDGSQIYEGQSFIYANDDTWQFAPSWENAVLSLDQATEKSTSSKVLPWNHEDRIPALYNALIFAIQTFFDQKGFQKAIIASSGGLDSALVQALVSQAIGGEQVFAYLLPSEFSSDHSISDAVALSTNLGNTHEIIPIKETYQTLLKSLAPQFESAKFDFTEENIQARIRGVMMMALSNKNGGVVINTSNKSEIAMGYSTMYGDSIGALSVIGDIYKSQAYALARYINSNKEVIPLNILEKAPSAELRSNQKDSDSLPEYDLLDGMLYKIIEEGKTDEAHFNEEEQEILSWVLQRIYSNEFKRVQFPPIIKVSRKSFFEDRKFPSIF